MKQAKLRGSFALVAVTTGALLTLVAPCPARADSEEAPALAALRARIAEIVAASGTPGVAVAMVDRRIGLTWTAGFGQASLANPRPMDADTLFRVGSLTKPFMALAVMRLVEQGRLRLEDKVRDLVPEIEVHNPWEKTHPLQLAHLLEHTAGFDEMRFNEIFDRDGQQTRSLRQVLAVNPRSRVSRWRPGTRFSYSQPGYTLVAAIIEKVTGMPYERFLDEQVFRPLGVEGAALGWSDAVRARLADGYDQGRPAPPVRLLHRPAGNLMISAAGLGRLLAVQLGRGEIAGQRFLTPASLDRIERCATVPLAPPAVCYGLGNWGDVSGPIPMRGHGGFMPGYQGFYRYSPSLGFGYVVLTNSSSTGGVLGAVGKQMFRHLMTGVTPPPPPRAPAGGDLGRHVGYYHLGSPGIEFMRYKTDVYAGLVVSHRAGQLFVQFSGRSQVIPLIPTGPDGFRFARDNATSVQFGRTPEGRRLVYLGGGYFEQQNPLWAGARKWAMEAAFSLLLTVLIAPLVLFLAGARDGASLLLRPFLAALCLVGMSCAFQHARHAGTLGVCNLATLAIWLLSWGLALASYQGFGHAVRGLRGPAPLFVRGYALAAAAAAVWITLHLSRYGIIGLRTWSW